MTFEILICDHFWAHMYSLNAIEYIFNNEKEFDKWPIWAEQRDFAQKISHSRGIPGEC